MKYQIRNAQPSYLEVNNIIDEFSFVRNHPIKQKDLTPRLQTRQNSGQLSSSDQTRSTQNRYRQSLQGRKSYNPQKLMFERSKGLRQSANERKQNEQNFQHLYQRQSMTGSNYPPSQVLKHEALQQSGEQIYQEIIHVLQLENSNLKEQNQYFIHEHKRILKQNTKLKAEIEELKSLNGLNIEIQRLKDINNAYQSQVEELKFILLEEIVAIHQKFNMYMSEEQASLMYNELNDSIKLSASRINTDRFTFVDQKNTKDERTPSTRTNSGMILAQMLEINQSEIFQKSPGKTAQTLDKQNILNYSNFDLKFNDSPTETTFSGHLRVSN